MAKAPPASARRIKAPTQTSVERSNWLTSLPNAAETPLRLRFVPSSRNYTRKESAMMSTRRSARSSATGDGLGLCMGAVIALVPASAFANVVDTFYERAVMTAADERCRLFTPQVASALAAGRAQARGAALRAGVSAD